MLTLQNFFRLLGILTMGAIYLPVVFFRLPAPLHTPTFYLLLWVIAILFTRPSMFISKLFIPVYLFLFIYFIGFATIWHNLVSLHNNLAIEFMYVRNELIWLFLATILISYFLQVKDYVGMKRVTISALLFMVVTSITSTIGFNLFPGAARMMASGSEAEMTETFKTIGIGTYGFFTSLMVLFPVMIYILKHGVKHYWAKLFILSALILAFNSIIKSEATTILILSALGILLAVFGQKKFNSTIIAFSVLAAIYLIFFQYQVSGLFYTIADYFPGSILERRFADLGRTFELTDVNLASNQSYTTGVRLKLSLISLNSFLSNPLFGGGNIGGHSFWLDRLGLFGLIGFAPWLLYFKNHFYLTSLYFDNTYKVYFIIASSIYLIYGLIKGGLGSPQDFVAVFFLLPAISFLQPRAKIKTT